MTALPDACAHCGARGLSVCSSLDHFGLSRVGGTAEHMSVPRGVSLCREGEPATHLFNITRGDVRVHKLLADGRRQIVGFLSAGDFLGLATGDRYAFTAEAMTRVEVCRFRRGDYRRMLNDLPNLESALLDRTAGELRAAHEQILLLGRKTAMERLSTFLLTLSERTGEEGAARMAMTRSEIADYLGVTTETISRNMSRLKAAGVIRLHPGRRFSITRPAELQRLAGREDVAG